MDQAAAEVAVPGRELFLDTEEPGRELRLETADSGRLEAAKKEEDRIRQTEDCIITSPMRFSMPHSV